HHPLPHLTPETGGTAPDPEMRDQDVPLGLGTHGPASNNSLDMFDTMKTTALVHKNARWDPTIMNAQRVLDMATLDGARCIGFEKVVAGVEIWKRADIVVVDLRDPNLIAIRRTETVVSD